MNASASRWAPLGAATLALLCWTATACDPTETSSADTGPVAADASLAGPDAQAPGPDAGPLPADAAAPGEDAASAPADAEAAAPDAAAGEDASVSTPDASPVVPLPGFGTITGECGVLDTELTDADPHLFENHLDFGTDQYDDPAEQGLLTPGGYRVVTTPNAGGSSVISEAFAIEVLVRCELATVLKTETEIDYTAAGGITDELVELDGLKIGVSVVRAMSYPRTADYPAAEALRVLEKKLKGINTSTSIVVPEDRWTKQILHVLADEQRHADAIRAAWQQTTPTLRADTVIVITVTDGADAPLYTN